MVATLTSAIALTSPRTASCSGHRTSPSPKAPTGSRAVPPVVPTPNGDDRALRFPVPSGVTSPGTEGSSTVDTRTPLATIVVAVDGPSGSGKSSVSRDVARQLGLRYLDTGAMYRAMTWWMLHNGVDVADAAAVAAAADKPELVSGTDPSGPTVTVDGIDVAGPIRGPEVTGAVSAVSAVPEIRTRLVAMQRAVIGSGGIVVEGRDIGTVVAPGAALKVYLTASEAARAARRNAESDDPATDVNATQADLARRDALDSGRATAPLAMAADGVLVDTTEMGRDQVVEHLLGLVAKAAESVGTSGATGTAGAGAAGAAVAGHAGEALR